MKPLPLILAVLFSGAPAFLAAAATTTDVSSLEQLRTAIERARPGDRIVVADGKYLSTGAITIARAGTQQQPIVVEARTVGGVEIEGEGGFRLELPAAYVVIKGFVFTHKAGAMTVGVGVHHCRITRNVFSLKVTGRSTFLTVNGDDNEIDHNTFRDKDTVGQMLWVQGTSPGTTMAKRTWVHHNYFLDFKRTGRNNTTALHIGSSHRSMDSGYSVIEHNLFVRTVGENEAAICNKSSDNVYRFNTIRDSTELSLRHGHRCQVYGNFMYSSDGVRFFGLDHVIHSNYFEGCDPAITIGNGGATIPPGPLESHERPDRVKVIHNTLVDNRVNVQMGKRRNGLGATALVFANNIIQGGPEAASIDGPLKDTTWAGNILWKTERGDAPAGGFTLIDPGLVKDDHGIYRLIRASPAIGAAVGEYPFVTVDLDGDPRPPAGRLDVGADQFSADTPANRPLTPADVGPRAREEEDRPRIAAPETMKWILKPSEP